MSDGIMPKFLEMFWLYGSSKTSRNYFETDEKKTGPGIEIPKIGALDDYGFTICKAAYTYKGDSPLIITAYEIISNLEEHIDYGHGTKYIEHIVKQAIELILDPQSHFKGPLGEKNIKFSASEEMFDLVTKNLINSE